MKNNFLIFIIIYIICGYNLAFSDSYTFETKKIEIIDEGKTIKALNGKAFSKDNNLEISSDNFEYFRDLDLLKSKNGQAFIKSKKLNIKYNSAIFNQKNLTFNAEGDVSIFKNDKDLIINTNKVTFDGKKNVISSNSVTEIKDNLNNTNNYVDSFIYEIDNNLIKVKNLISKDSANNLIQSSLAFINTRSGKIFGKDMEVLLNETNAENPYRLKGKSVIINSNVSTEINKGVFTTCKNRGNCVPWKISAKKIVHDQVKKNIIYDDAILSLYNMPIAYFPKFFHPDPSVKRKSGFLIPSIKNSSSAGGYVDVPYFNAISENKDFTLTPRIYNNENFLIQTEYRQKDLRIDQIADFSFFNEKKKTDKSHFFYKLDKEFITKNFDISKLVLNLQSVSDDTYLKSNKLKNNITQNFDVLENSLKLDFFSNDIAIKVDAITYENLNASAIDRYEHILPRLSLSQNLNKYFPNLAGNLRLDSETAILNYNSNVYEKFNINNIFFKSQSFVKSNGFINDYEFLIKNSNSDNKNSIYKNKENLYLSGIFQFNSALPMIKKTQFYNNIIKPKISFKIAPKHTPNDNNSDNQVDVNNIYSINRVSNNRYIEGGLSASYGFEYSTTNILKSREIATIKLANNLRLNENNEINNNNQLNEKTSNIFAEIIYDPNEFITTKYSSSIKNNLNDLSYENFISQFKINNLITKFDYLNENNTKDKSNYITNNTEYNLNNSNSFSFSTRKNKSKDLTEYYKLMYQYKNDCLVASFEFSKDFYSDRDLKPEESVLFKLSLIPFTSISTPNISD